MTERDPVNVKNLDIYGSGPLEWSRARDGLLGGAADKDTPYFLGTTRPDGRPHAAGIGAVYHDGDLYIVIGPETRKARNLAANPACTMSVRLPGIDLVVEGTAQRVTDAATLNELVKIYQDGGWPAEVQGDAFTAPYSAPSAGPPPWHLYRIAMHAAFGVATAEPYGATRWKFRP